MSPRGIIVGRAEGRVLVLYGRAGPVSAAKLSGSQMQGRRAGSSRHTLKPTWGLFWSMEPAYSAQLSQVPEVKLR